MAHNGDTHQHAEGSFREELLHHLPYAIFSVALGMIILSLLDYIHLFGIHLILLD